MEVNMKRLSAIISIFIVCTGFNFSTEGSSIQKYDHPKTALLVLDMQEDFLGENAKAPIKREQIPGITSVVNSLVDDFEKNGQLIIYVKSEFPKIALGNRIRNHAAIVGTPGTEIYNKIKVSGNAIFSKKKPDAFSNPEFEKYLVSNQINQLVITGVYANQCVLYTSLGALKRKYQIKFVKNGVGDRSEEEVNEACDTIKKGGGEVIEYRP
jgi:nicotinamidase-related amidase